MTRARLLFAVLAAAAAGLLLALLLGRADETRGPPAGPTPVAPAGRAPPLADRPTLDELTTPVLQYDDDPAGDERLEGQVVDADEQPVGAAVVVIDANPPREVVTEADGSFAFDRLVGRTYSIEARAGDAIAGPAAVQVSPSAEPVVLRLRRAARLIVDVRRADSGAPIAGALVELRGLTGRVATTDPDGVAVIGGVGGGWHVVRASATGYASEFAELATAGEPGQEAHVTFRMRAGVSVGGVVVDGAGAPVEGARVISEVATRAYDPSDARLDGAVTDAKGRWRLTGLARETSRFHAYHAAYAPAATAPLPLGDGVDREQVEIVLPQGARLRGHVVRGGAPLPGAEVRVVGADARAPQVRRVRCDAAGRFTIGGLPRRALHVLAAIHGATSEVVGVDLARGEPADIELAIELDATITGVVVTSAGARVPEARVVADPVNTGDPLERVVARLRGRPSTVADGDGGFRLGGLQPGAYTVRAIRPGDAPDLVDMKLGAQVEAGASSVRVVVDDLTVLTGRVAFRDGRAPPAFTVTLGTAPPRSFAGTDGAFRIDAVPSGRQYVQIDGPDIVPEGRADVEVVAGAVHDLGTIQVDRGRVVAGLVVDAAGTPVVGALVVLGREIKGDGATLIRAGDPPLRQAVTGADGRFALRGLGPGAHVLAADHDTIGRSPTLDVGPGATDVDATLTLRPTGAVQGFVRQRGAPVAAFVQLRAIDAANAQWTIQTGNDGSFRFDRAAPGPYILWAGVERGSRMGGSDGVGQRVEVRSAAVLDADFDIDPGELTVTLRIESEAVEFGYGLIARDATGTMALPHTVDEARRILVASGQLDVREGMIVRDRQIVFEQVPAGRYVACVAPLRGDPSDPSVVAELQQDLVDWPVHCLAVELAAAPLRQEIRVPTAPR